MRNRLWMPIALLALLVAPGLSLRASARPAGEGPLEVYTSFVDQAGLEMLLAADLDMAPPRRVDDGYAVELVLAPLEHAALAQQGLPLELWRNAEGLSAAEQSVIDQNQGFAS